MTSKSNRSSKTFAKYLSRSADRIRFSEQKVIVHNLSTESGHNFNTEYDRDQRVNGKNQSFERSVQNKSRIILNGLEPKEYVLHYFNKLHNNHPLIKRILFRKFAQLHHPDHVRSEDIELANELMTYAIEIFKNKHQ